MTAREMFEKLGYKYEEREDVIECIYKDEKYCYADTIIFDKFTKRFQTFSGRTALEVDVKTLAAICQQIKELGWLE